MPFTATSHEPRGRVTVLVDFLADPDDDRRPRDAARWVDREARQADSDKIRTFAMHAGFRRVLKRAGYFQVKSTMQFVVKVNGIDVAPSFYEDTDRWHVTLGDSDQDRYMHLLVGIDTEGDNQWDAAARVNQRSRTSTRCRGCTRSSRRHGVRPTYVITHPVATDARSAEVLRALQAGGDCEIGAHHHAWETPPCTADDVAAASVRVDAAARAVRGSSSRR